MTDLLIGGQWTPAADGATFPTLNPADATLITTCAQAGPADVDRAVAAAREALDDPEWAELPAAARARLLWRVADLVEEHADELALLEHRDNGQPLPVARTVSVPATAEHFRYFAGWCTKIEGSVLPVSYPNTFHYTRREPVGVCALITPWNFPLLIAAWKLAPALACGNTVILKPAEQTPLTAVRLVELMTEAGFPPGVVNLLTGGPRTGAALASHDDVDKVSFTGSTEVGRSLVHASAGNLKRLTLELGGKTPSIIAADADIDAAVAGNVQGALFNSGQVCAAYARFYVDRKRADEFTTKMADAARAAQPELGPLVSEEHLLSVDRHVKTAVYEGASLITGGNPVRGPGFFYEPTVFADVTDQMAIAREEVFGPVIPVLAYDDPDELVARANGLEYGLAASIWTNDLSTAHRLAARIRAGAVFINMIHVPDAATTWGGYKASGWGREMGPYAIDAYTEVKGVWTHLGGA